ncbi:MAG: hypothetical protein HGA25_11815 [Clostridiales bacterium]|nr:hypothetical protein [Clostridiales bacterium]
MEGNAVSDAYLSDLLFDYLPDEEEQETVFLGDFESVIGKLAGEILTEGEEYIGEDGCCYNADTMIEEESGEEYPLEEFLDMVVR